MCPYVPHSASHGSPVSHRPSSTVAISSLSRNRRLIALLTLYRDTHV